MKKFFPIIIASVLIGVYLVFSLAVFPPFYLSKEIPDPQPYFDVKISNLSILLGESFDVSIFSKNIGDYGDIHILSIGFPSIDKITEVKLIQILIISIILLKKILWSEAITLQVIKK